MVAVKSLRKALLRIVADSPIPMTVTELQRQLKVAVDYEFSEDCILRQLSDLMLEGELLPDTAFHFRRYE